MLLFFILFGLCITSGWHCASSNTGFIGAVVLAPKSKLGGLCDKRVHHWTELMSLRVNLVGKGNIMFWEPSSSVRITNSWMSLWIRNQTGVPAPVFYQPFHNLNKNLKECSTNVQVLGPNHHLIHHLKLFSWTFCISVTFVCNQNYKVNQWRIQHCEHFLTHARSEQWTLTQWILFLLKLNRHMRVFKQRSFLLPLFSVSYLQLLY